MEQPLLSVIIPTRNEEDNISKCLDALTHQKYAKPYEIIVVDTNSTDKTTAIAKSFKAKVISENKKGKIYAFIKGANAAKGDILCFTEADCIVPPHWLSTITTYFQKNPTVTAISGTYLFYASTTHLNILAKMCFAVSKWVFKIMYGNDSLRASNFAIRKNAYKKAGGFSNKYFELYDVELGLRVGTSGTIHHVDTMEIQTSDRRFRGRIFKYIGEFLPSFVANILLRKPLKTQTYQDIR
jgi:glycosyltransferase involved in cell wall biosynthesis